MGVMGLFSFLADRYPLINQPLEKIPQFDNLYIDGNGIIHKYAEHINKQIAKREIEELVFVHIKDLVEKIKPKKLIYIAFDGVPPKAKWNAQKERKSSSKNSKHINKQEITAGTIFMNTFCENFKKLIQNEWKIEVIFSGSNVPGESEHKIIEYIRYHKSQPSFDPNTKHCLYGGDSDLITLALITQEPHFSLLREFTQQNDSKLYFLHLSLLREYLQNDFNQSHKKELERVIDDVIFITFLVGNDFLPPLYSHPEALQNLFDSYKKFPDYLVKKNQIDHEKLLSFLQMIPSRNKVHNAKYLQGLNWILNYYHFGCNSWDWCYPIESSTEEEFLDFLKSLKYEPYTISYNPPNSPDHLKAVLNQNVNLSTLPLSEKVEIFNSSRTEYIPKYGGNNLSFKLLDSAKNYLTLDNISVQLDEIDQDSFSTLFYEKSKLGISCNSKPIIPLFSKIMERSDCEFKVQEFNWSDKKHQIEFVKDVLALHNSFKSSVMIFGVPDGDSTTRMACRYQFGIKEGQLHTYFQSDGTMNSNMKQIFHTYATGSPTLHFHQGKIHNLQFSIIEIEKTNFPLTLKKECGTITQKTNCLFPNFPFRTNKNNSPGVEWIQKGHNLWDKMWELFDKRFTDFHTVGPTIWVRLPLPGPFLENLTEFQPNCVFDCAEDVWSKPLEESELSYGHAMKGDDFCTKNFDSPLYRLPFNPKSKKKDNNQSLNRSFSFYQREWILMNIPHKNVETADFTDWVLAYDQSFEYLVSSLFKNFDSVNILAFGFGALNKFHFDLLSRIAHHCEKFKNISFLFFTNVSTYPLRPNYPWKIIEMDESKFFLQLKFLNPIKSSNPYTNSSIHLNYQDIPIPAELFKKITQKDVLPLTISTTSKIKNGDLLDPMYDRNERNYLRGGSWTWNDLNEHFILPNEENSLLKCIGYYKLESPPFFANIEVAHHPGDGGSSYIITSLSFHSVENPVLVVKKKFDSIPEVNEVLNLVAELSAKLDSIITIFFDNPPPEIYTSSISVSSLYRIIVVSPRRIPFSQPLVPKNNTTTQKYRKLIPLEVSTTLYKQAANFYKNEANEYYSYKNIKRILSELPSIDSFFLISFYSFFEHKLNIEDYLETLIKESTTFELDLFNSIAIIQYNLNFSFSVNWIPENLNVDLNSGWKDFIVLEANSIKFRHPHLITYFLKTLNSSKKIFHQIASALNFLSKSDFDNESDLVQILEQKSLLNSSFNENKELTLESLRSFSIRVPTQKFHLDLARARLLKINNDLAESFNQLTNLIESSSDTDEKCLSYFQRAEVLYLTLKGSNERFIEEDLLSDLLNSHQYNPRRTPPLKFLVTRSLDFFKNNDSIEQGCIAFFKLALFSPYVNVVNKENLELLKEKARNTKKGILYLSVFSDVKKLQFQLTDLPNQEEPSLKNCLQFLQGNTLVLENYLLLNSEKIQNAPPESSIPVRVELNYSTCLNWILNQRSKKVPVYFLQKWQKDSQYKSDYCISASDFNDILKLNPIRIPAIYDPKDPWNVHLTSQTDSNESFTILIAASFDFSRGRISQRIAVNVFLGYGCVRGISEIRPLAWIVN